MGCILVVSWRLVSTTYTNVKYLAVLCHRVPNQSCHCTPCLVTKLVGRHLHGVVLCKYRCCGVILLACMNKHRTNQTVVKECLVGQRLFHRDFKAWWGAALQTKLMYKVAHANQVFFVEVIIQTDVFKRKTLTCKANVYLCLPFAVRCTYANAHMFSLSFWVEFLNYENDKMFKSMPIVILLL